MLDLISQSLICDDQHCDISISDWNSLFKELSDQTVSAIPTNLLMRLVPKEGKNKVIRTASSHIVNMNKHLREQDLLKRLFEENHVPFVILKGLAVARYYPHPEYRTLGDIDIAVLHDDYEKAHQLMLQSGFSEVKSDYEKHGEFMKNGIIFELHKYFVSTNDIKFATYIENQIQEGIKKPTICELKGYRFPTLPPVANGIMLLEHMSQHLEAGMGLRHLLDWMMYVSEELDDSIWKDEFVEVAEASGLRRLAEVVTQVCVKYLGLTGISWSCCADDGTCERLIMYILQRGNFGYKSAPADEKAQKLIAVHKGLVDWLRYLQRTGLETIPFIKRHLILHPFAWLARGIVLICRYWHEGNSLSGLRAEHTKAMELDSFFDELGIRRVSRGHTYWNGESFIVKR